MRENVALGLTLVLLVACSGDGESATRDASAPAEKATVPRKDAAESEAGPEDGGADADAGTQSTAGTGASMNDGGPSAGSRAGANGSAAGAGGTQASAGGSAAGASAAAAGSVWLTSSNWSAPAPLENGSAEIYGTSVAQNRTGDSVVSWLQAEPDGFFWMRRFVQGAWEPVAFRASNDVRPPEGYGGYFGVGIDAQGIAQLLYRGVDASMPMNFKTYWSAWEGNAVTLVDAAPLIFGGSSAVGVPAILDVADDRTIAVWTDVRTPGVGPLYCNVRGVAGTWGTPQRLGEINDVFLSSGFARDEAGRFIFAVVSAPLVEFGTLGPIPGENTLRSFMVDGAGTRELPSFTLPDMIQGNQLEVQLDAAGNAMVVVAVGYDAGRSAYWTRYRAATNTWSALEKLTEKVAGTTPLLLLPFGEVLALAQEVEGPTGPGVLTARIYTDAGGSAPVALSDSDYFDWWSPHAAMNPAGEVIVVWQQKKYSNSLLEGAVLSRRYSHGKWSALEVLRTYAVFGAITYGGDVRVEGVTLAENGRALVIMANHATPDHMYRPFDLEWMQSM
jgi:hypothetical protein